jgi:hypothetical protein
MDRRRASLALVGLTVLLCYMLGCSDSSTGLSNNPPTITALRAEPDLVDPSGQSTISCDATDPDGDSLTFTWDKQAGELSGSGALVTWVAPDPCGVYSISVAVRDGRRGEATAAVEVVVVDAAIPVQWSANGHWYQPIDTVMSWSEAQADAESRSWMGLAGHLITITSQEEQDFLVSSFGPEQLGHIWLGGYQHPPSTSDPEANWCWVTGEPWDYTHWMDGEPNDAWRGGECYLETRTTPTLLWNDAPCYGSASRRAFGVEYE